jgi:hypothetical protein
MSDLGVKAKRPMPVMLVDGGMIAATTDELAKQALPRSGFNDADGREH